MTGPKRGFIGDRVVPQGFLRWCLVGAVFMSCFSVLWLSGVVDNDTYDAYDYLAGVRAFAEAKPHWYPSIRPFGPSLLGVGWSLIFDRVEEAAALFRVLHLQSGVLTVVFLAVSGVVFRRLGKTGVLLPLAFLALSRLILRYGWSFLSDIPAALLVTSGFVFVLRRRVRGWDWLWAGLCFGVAANFKFYLIVSGMVGAVGWMVTRRGERFKEALGLAGTSLVAAVVLHCGAAIGLTGGTLPGFSFWLQVFGGQVLGGAGMDGVAQEAWWAYLPLVGGVFGLLAPGFLAVGVVEALRRKGQGEKLALVWVGGLGALLALAGHHEARYLFPILPPIVWLIALGVLKVGEWLSSARRDRQTLVIAVALVGAFWSVVLEGVGLSEPWLRQPFQRRMCRETTDLGGGTSEFLFTGPFYPLIIGREVFSSHDAFYSIFHFGPSQLIFWEGVDARLSLGSQSENGVWLPLEAPLWPGRERCVVSSGYQMSVDASSLEWALGEPRPLHVISEESVLFVLENGDGGSRYCSSEGGECIGSEIGGRRVPGIFGEDWYALDSRQTLRRIDETPAGLSDIKGAMPKTLIRRRWRHLDDQWPEP